MNFPAERGELPAVIRNAAKDGKEQVVLEFLATAADNVRHWSGASFLTQALTSCAHGRSLDPGARPGLNATPAHLSLMRSLLDRGADPKTLGWIPLHMVCGGSGESSVEMVALLLERSGNYGVNRRDARHKLPLVLTVCGFGYYADPARHLRCRRIIRLLLRAGASPSESDIDEQCVVTETGIRCLEEASVNPDTQFGHPQFTWKHYLATKQLILDMRAAGSPRAYRMTSRKQVLSLRSLALRGRAKPRDARMKFFVESPNDRLEGPRVLAHGAGLLTVCLEGPVPLHRDPRPRLHRWRRRRRRRVLVDASY